MCAITLKARELATMEASAVLLVVPADRKLLIARRTPQGELKVTLARWTEGQDGSVELEPPRSRITMTIRPPPGGSPPRRSTPW